MKLANQFVKLNKRDIKKIIKKVYPHSQLVRYKDISEGIINLMYEVQIKKPNKTFIIRVINLKFENLKNLLGDKFKREADVLEYWSKLGFIRTPKLLYKDRAKKLIPYSYLALEKIHGKSMAKVFRKFSAKKQKQFYKQLGAILGKIHSIKAKSQAFITKDEKTRRFKLEYVKWNYNTLDWLPENRGIKKTKFANYFKLIKNYLKKQKLLHFKPAIGLRHNDFDSTNIIIEKGKISGLLDLESSDFGDIQQDLARAEIRLFEEGLISRKLIPEMKKAFFNGYLKFNKIPKDYEKMKKVYYLMIAVDDMEMFQKLVRKKYERKKFETHLKHAVDYILKHNKTEF